MVDKLIVIDEVTQANLKIQVYEEMSKIETDLDKAKVAENTEIIKQKQL